MKGSMRFIISHHPYKPPENEGTVRIISTLWMRKRRITELLNQAEETRAPAASQPSPYMWPLPYPVSWAARWLTQVYATYHLELCSV